MMSLEWMTNNDCTYTFIRASECCDDHKDPDQWILLTASGTAVQDQLFDYVYEYLEDYPITSVDELAGFMNSIAPSINWDPDDAVPLYVNRRLISTYTSGGIGAGAGLVIALAAVLWLFHVIP